MKKISIGIVTLVIVIIIIGGIAIEMLTTTVSPQNIIISEANVTNELITIMGDFSVSAVGYKTYKVEYKDGKLFVKIKGSSINLTKLNGAFNIFINNKYGKIEEVYLQGNPTSDVHQIWPNK